MADRRKLSRAGIVNVYQYADETLQFADGRLLLRGVNGSGKSTAMNMLLPFLLDADTRRIDAAGEQAGVLKSWMLAGRDDPQPVGYLWIELARGEDHVTCGCGIKANRAADTVTTWWFVTSRRPGVDLDLVEARHPLGAEALRATLGSDPVFRHDQRGAYQAEVRARLFGGAEIDQHVHLLHVVRNPRSATGSTRSFRATSSRRSRSCRTPRSTTQHGRSTTSRSTAATSRTWRGRGPRWRRSTRSTRATPAASSGAGPRPPVS